MSLKETNILKGLETKLKSLESNREYYKQQNEDIQSTLRTINTNLKSLNNEIWKIKNKNEDIIVSEHAIVRYLETVMGIDLEDLMKKIIPEEIKQQALELGDGKYNYDNYTIVIKDNTLVTVYKQ